MKPEVMNEEPISIGAMKKLLTDIKARDGELNFRAGKTEEYLNYFASLDAKVIPEFLKKLAELEVPRLKPIHMAKIVDVMPKHADDLKLLFAGDPITISQDNMKKIVGVVAEFAK